MLLCGSTFPRRDVIGAWLKRDALRASRGRDPSGARRRRPRPGIRRRPGAGRAARTRAGPDPRRSPAIAASRPFCTKGLRPASTSPTTDAPPSPIPSSPAPESSTRVHDVPLCRQLIAPDEWDQHGGWALGDRVEWSNRACGLASLRMILLAYGRTAPTVTELLKLAVKHEVLTPRGALHTGIAGLATDFGVPSRAEPVAAEELTGRLDDAPLIVSITETFPEDGRTGGHLVILHGYEDGCPDPVVRFRDPSAWGQTHDRVPLSRLTRSYSGRAITFAPLTLHGES
ncbi:C39 family peptidase [Streptomyces cacaoi]